MVWRVAPAIFVCAVMICGCSTTHKPSKVVAANVALLEQESAGIARFEVGGVTGRVLSFARGCGYSGNVVLGGPDVVLDWIPTQRGQTRAPGDLLAGLLRRGYTRVPPPPEQINPKLNKTRNIVTLRRHIGDRYVNAMITQWLPGVPSFRKKRPYEVTVELNFGPDSGC